MSPCPTVAAHGYAAAAWALSTLPSADTFLCPSQAAFPGGLQGRGLGTNLLFQPMSPVSHWGQWSPSMVSAMEWARRAGGQMISKERREGLTRRHS